MKTLHSQNSISRGFFQHSNLNQRKSAILADVSAKLGFQPAEPLGESSWWGSSHIGAFQYLGIFRGKDAVLKIQGVKPHTSEAIMITAFNNANRSTLIRPPFIYAHLPWNNQDGYEVIVLERVSDDKLFVAPTDIDQLARFRAIYRDYRRNCLHSPWVQKPAISISHEIRHNFADFRRASNELFGSHPLKAPNDSRLIDHAVEALATGYMRSEFEFQHGHFSYDDFRKQEGKVILLSNLYWSWRPPYYDLVFGYYWFLYRLASFASMTAEQMDAQSRLVLSRLWKMAEEEHRPRWQRLLRLALLERATAGLVIDSLTVDRRSPLAAHAVDVTRQSVRTLLSELDQHALAA